jgi:hypothetical protein
VLPNDPLYRVDRTDRGAHRLSAQTQDEIHGEDDEPHHGRVSGVDEAVEALDASCRKLDEPFPVRIDVDDAIERDNVGGRDRLGQLDEVAVAVRDAIAEATAGALLLGRLEVEGRGVDARGVGRAGGEQLVLDGADAAADVEQSGVLDPFGFSASINVWVDAIGPFSRYLRS